MTHRIGMLVLMITVGVLGFTAGKYAQPTAEPQVLSRVETAEPHVVLVKAGERQQKETLKQNEGCPVVPNEGLGRQRANEQEKSIMKGLVF